MVQLSDEQVDMIHQRIIGDGVTTTGLQNDLLDHYCSFIEEAMDHGGDFESAYNKAFRAITPNGMHEIEEELFIVLTFKNHTNMKRTILVTGAICTALLTAGIILKYLFAPGASVLIVTGITTAALVFMPMVFLLKIREKRTPTDKALWSIGSLFAITIALAVMFKVQHWPGANVMGVLAALILLVLFLPVYFFSGIRKPDTKVNTVVTSVFIFIGCGLFFTMLMTPRATNMIDTRLTKNYLRNEQILKNEQKSAQQYAKTNPAKPDALSKEMYNRCEELKSFLVKCETGNDAIGEDFESRHLVIGDHSAMDYFYRTPEALTKLKELQNMSVQYNTAMKQPAGLALPVPVTSNIIDLLDNKTQYKVPNALNDLIQIQMILLQNEKSLAAL